MLASIITAVFCAPLSSQAPLDVPAQRADGASAVEVGIHLTETQFSARSFSEVPQVLMFRCAESRVLVLQRLAPGSQVSWTFPRHALNGIELEVVSLENGAWHHTGAMPLSQVLDNGAENLWIQSAGAHSLAWMQIGTRLALFQSEDDLLPSAIQALDGESATNASELAPTHVPVITPSDKPTGDAPPKLEERPLPPV